MLNIIPPSVHRALDLVTVAIFALAPILLRLDGTPAQLSYALAGIHLLLTLATRFPDMRKRPIALRVHGSIELLVGVVLLLLPWISGWSGTPRTFYSVMGVIVLLVWLLSKYQHTHVGE